MRIAITSIFLVSLAACGGGSDAPAPPPPAPPQAPPAAPPPDTSTPLALKVETVHVNQVIQNTSGDLPVFADREGLLRVFVTANRSNDARPRVRIEVFHDGALTETHDVDAQSTLVPTSLELGDLNQSWNVRLPAAHVRDGLAVRATVDPDGTYVDTPVVYPADGTPLAVSVATMPVFRTTLVPVNYQAGNEFVETTVNQNVLNAQFVIFDRIFPVPARDVVVREPYTTTAVTRDAVNMSQLLQELRNLRDQADNSDRYYYGNIHWGPFNRPAHGGIAYLGYPVGLGQNGNDWIYAHEVGHNFSLQHAPCGNPPNTDPAFPHTNGRVGFPGWDIATGGLRPATAVDIMGYCSQQTMWISDYMYRKAFQFRAQESHSATPAPALVIWGAVMPDGISLRPSYVRDARDEGDVDPRGQYVAEGLDRHGRIVFQRRFSGVPVAHGDERHFSIAVPVADARLDGLATVRVRGPRHSAEITAGPGAREKAATPPTLDRIADDRVRIRWDASRHPLAVVRNPETGNILSFAEGGDVTVVTRAERLEVELSDGVAPATGQRVHVEVR